MIRFAISLMILCLAVSQGYAEEKRFDIPLVDSPSEGPQNAPVTIIEFLDYQ